MRINPIIYGVLILIVFFGIIFGFQAVGIWSTSGKVDSSGKAVQPLADDVNTIKGWMTLDQIVTTYNVSLAELLTQFDLPADTLLTTAISELENESFSVTNLRTWLQSRTQPAVIPSGESTLPAPIMEEIATTTPAAEVTIALAPTEHVTSAKTVTGKTTFQELLDWGVPQDAIQQVIGGNLPVLSTVIKDYVTGKGLEFTVIKTQLQMEVDKIK